MSILTVTAGLAGPEGPVLAEEPLSAIDWLSQSVSTPSSLPRGTVVTLPGAGSPGKGVAPPSTITVTSLDRQLPASLGLISAARSGLPRDIWAASSSADLARLIRAERPDTLPAMRRLLGTLLIAEFAPPRDGDPQNALFLARIDMMLDMGNIDPALALLDLIERPDAETFRRFFDVSLLVGEEDHACRIMGKNPQIAPTFPARIFCLARGGDWNAAALALRTGTSLASVDPPTSDLLSRFLDPELYEGDGELPTPDRPSPLTFRLMEAIGQPMSTTTMPVAFAQADLRSNNGWKSRIEAGERLARMGAIPPNRLLGLYSEQRAAASGGVWERVSAIQAFEAALNVADQATLATTLPAVWEQMEALELEVPFAQLFGARLSTLGLEGDTGALAFRIGLLSDAYEAVAQRRSPADTNEAFFIGIARGEAQGLTPPDQLGVAIQAAFAADPGPSEEFAPLLAGHRLGEVILKAIDKVTLGAGGDLRDVTEGLAMLRRLGLEQAARQAALELMLLERRG